jgi:hypothetical protein
MVQTCPHCGRRIVTCSMCRACDTEDNYCTHCCLDYQAKVENEEAEREAEFKTQVLGIRPKAEEPKEYKVPFLRHQWCDVVVKASSREEAVKIAMAVFTEGHDGYLCWEDVDVPELDKYAWEQQAIEK